MTALAARPSGRWARFRRDLGREETRWAFLFLLPWIIGFIIFTGGPMIASLVISFTNMGLAPRLRRRRASRTTSDWLPTRASRWRCKTRSSTPSCTFRSPWAWDYSSR